MAVFQCDIGMQGAGKSLRSARIIWMKYTENVEWFHKSGTVRKIACNFPLNLDVIEPGASKFFLPQWNDVKDLCKLRDCDVIWDEVANDLDARNFAMLSSEVKRLLSRADKRGLEIFANTQDFDMIDKRARRMMTGVFEVKKWLGSQRPCATKPVVEKPWGLFVSREFENYRDESAVMDPGKRQFSVIPHDIFFLEKRYLDLYDTLYETGTKKYPPLEHVEQECEIHGRGCSFKKISHL